MTAVQAGKPRHAYMDALRILAAFLVIVNHTNSDVFKAGTPGELSWVLSILWYYVSKLAVPVFVMLSGACLLDRVDSYRRVAWRFARVLLALLLFSYMFFLYDAWVNYGLWPRAVDFGAFFTRVWRMEILDDFWYLYMYLGLMLMLPLMQRLASAMKSRDMLYLIVGCIVLDALCPLIAHYAPELALPRYFSAPMFSAYIGLFFAGHWLHGHIKPCRKTALWCAVALALSLAVSALLTYAESFRAEKYWFMDDRMQPSVFTIIAAISALGLVKTAFARPLSDKSSAALRELGGCAFGVYLWQGFLIQESENRLYAPLCALMPNLCAALVWELVVFTLAVALTWLMRKIPYIKKIL